MFVASPAPPGHSAEEFPVFSSPTTNGGATLTKERSGRMALMGVRRKWQNSHIGVVLALSIIQQSRLSQFSLEVMRAELSWILDSNKRMKQMLTLVGGTVYKRYRIYEKALS